MSKNKSSGNTPNGKVKNQNGGCCKGSEAAKDGSKKSKGILQGLACGLIPHIGCIAFIIGSVLGATVLMGIFKPLLMNRYFFYGLIAISIGFATISSAIYLRKNGQLSLSGMGRKWKYLTTMYGSTIGVNLVLFLLVFPLLANFSAASPSVTGNSLNAPGAPGIGSLGSIKLQVDIPCSGHAPLITDELKSIDGVQSVQFSLPNIFDVSYNPAKTSKDAMLALSVFKEYPAKVLEESSVSALPNNIATSATNGLNNQNNPASGGGCCGGGGGSCGGSSGGGCGCGG